MLSNDRALIRSNLAAMASSTAGEAVKGVAAVHGAAIVPQHQIADARAMTAVEGKAVMGPEVSV
jgi:hypothetical protein